MAQRADPAGFVHRTAPNVPRLILSRCLECGHLVAASWDRRLLRLVENRHKCDGRPLSAGTPLAAEGRPAVDPPPQ